MDIPLFMQPREPLTPKQEQVYRTLKEYILEHGKSPTVQELRNKLGAKWPNAVHKILVTLEEKDYILRRKGSRRNIELRRVDVFGELEPTISVPVVASVGCDDLSVFAQDSGYHDEFLEVDKAVLEGCEHPVAVRAVGSSMNDAGINEGDYVLVRPGSNAQSGDQIAAIVGDMITIKKLDRQNGLTILRPVSKDPKYKPIVMRGDFAVARKIIAVIPSPGAVYADVVPIEQ
jgi:repressor LexA